MALEEFDYELSTMLNVLVFTIKSKAALGFHIEEEIFHPAAICTPCKFFHNKCHMGLKCRYCHLCPPKALRNKKRIDHSTAKNIRVDYTALKSVIRKQRTRLIHYFSGINVTIKTVDY